MKIEKFTREETIELLSKSSKYTISELNNMPDDELLELWFDLGLTSVSLRGILKKLNPFRK